MCLEREEALRNKRKVCFSYIKLVYNIRYQLNQSSEVHVAIYCTLTIFNEQVILARIINHCPQSI